MASEHYRLAISELEEYFGISQVCAQYLFHRALRARRKDDKYLPYTLKLQNALIKADKCLGINWERVMFGYEAQNLLVHGIIIDDMPDIVFRWTEDAKEYATDTYTSAADIIHNTEEYPNTYTHWSASEIIDNYQNDVDDEDSTSWTVVGKKKRKGKKKEKVLLAAKIGIYV